MLRQNHLFLDEMEHSFKVTKPAWVLTLPALLGTVVEAKKNAGSKIKVSFLCFSICRPSLPKLKTRIIVLKVIVSYRLNTFSCRRSNKTGLMYPNNCDTGVQNPSFVVFGVFIYSYSTLLLFQNTFYRIKISCF